MKKTLVFLLALALVGVAFAAEPAAELKIAEFKGDASGIVGVDLDNGSIAFGNSANADIKIQFAGAGDKVTSGSDIWGELKIKTDGDPVGLKLEGTKLSDLAPVAGKPFYGYKVVVDVAKIHFGSMFALGIKADGTLLNYATIADEAAGFYIVDTTKYYGTLNSAYDTLLVKDAAEKVGFDAANGFVLEVTLPDLLNAYVDIRTPNAWAADGTIADPVSTKKNAFGLRGKVDVKALKDLTLQAGFSTGFGGTETATSTVAVKYNMGFGGLVAYKLMLDDVMFIQPKVGVDATMTTATTANFGYIVQAGALFGWGAKGKMNLYFSPDKDKDWGYYPGVAVGILMKSKDVYATTTTGGTMGLAASFYSGTLIPNLTANAVLEIADLMATNMVMGISANAKYAIAMDPMTLTPRFGVYYYSDASKTVAEQKTDIYVKAGLEIAKIFPNTSLTFEYASNDFNGGVNNAVAAAALANGGKNGSLGMFTTTVKIAF